MKIKLVLIDTYPVPQRIAPPVYYIPDEVQHISHWTYSPAGCHKRVETVFGE